MNTKTLILIVILALVAAGLFGFAYTSMQQTTSPTTTSQTTPGNPTISQTIPATAVLYFEPESITSTSSSSITVTIMADSHENILSGIQAEMQYDPQILTNMKITPIQGVVNNAFFGEKDEQFILFNEVDQKLGRASYAVGIIPSTTPKAGIGKVATLTFSKRAGSTPTTITFLPTTTVTQLESTTSVLKESRPLVIN